MHFSMEKCITFELDFIRSKMTEWKVRKKKFAFFWVRHENFLTLLFCSTCPISGKPPPGTGCPVEFSGFSGTLKFQRVTPSNAFKKTHRQNSREMTSDARVTHESSSQVPGGHFAARARSARENFPARTLQKLSSDKKQFPPELMKISRHRGVSTVHCKVLMTEGGVDVNCLILYIF